MSTFDPTEYWENRLRKHPGFQGIGSIELGKQFNSYLYKVRRNVFLTRLESTGQDFRDANVLDVGCGTGFYVERWKELRVRKIAGLDFTDVAIEYLRQQYPDSKFYQTDIGSDIQNLETLEFDVVSAFDVLFHIVDDERYENAIGNIYSLLKPGGLFVWSDNFLHGETFRSPHHVCRPLDSIESMLMDVGFHIVERRPMFYLMNAPLDSESRLCKALWKIITRIVSKGELFGFLVGSFLYPIELLLVLLATEGPSTEMMICRKPV